MSTSIDTSWQTFDAVRGERRRPIDSSLPGVCPSFTSSQFDLSNPSADYVDRRCQTVH